MSSRAGDPLTHARRIRETILRRHGFDSEDAVPGVDSASAIDDATNLARISSHWGITSRVPVAGRFLVLGKRAIRIGLRWYINPIVDQQNAFNDAVVRALHDLQAENDKLRASLNETMQEPSE